MGRASSGLRECAQALLCRWLAGQSLCFRHRSTGSPTPSMAERHPRLLACKGSCAVIWRPCCHLSANISVRTGRAAPLQKWLPGSLKRQGGCEGSIGCWQAAFLGHRFCARGVSPPGCYCCRRAPIYLAFKAAPYKCFGSSRQMSWDHCCCCAACARLCCAAARCSCCCDAQPAAYCSAALTASICCWW